MKPKTIKSYLKKRVNKWIDSIDDPEIKEIAYKGSIITGGAIVSLLRNEKVNDLDIYFKDKQTVKRIAEYYVERFNKTHGPIVNKIGNNESLFVLDGDDVEAWKNGTVSLTEIAPNYLADYPEQEVSRMIAGTKPGRIKVIFPSDGIVGEMPEEIDREIQGEDPMGVLEELDETPGELLESSDDKAPYRPIFFTTNSICLSGKIQLIIRFYGSAEEIHKTYDFEHCCCHYDVLNNELVTPEKSLLCVLNKDLFYRGSHYPICSIFRTRKFIERGWKINAGQYLKMCFQVSELDLTDVDILEDQLVGVDTLYFKHIIDNLRKLKQNNPDFTIDGSYVTSIVDKIF